MSARQVGTPDLGLFLSGFNKWHVPIPHKRLTIWRKERGGDAFGRIARDRRMKAKDREGRAP